MVQHLRGRLALVGDAAVSHGGRGPYHHSTDSSGFLRGASGGLDAGVGVGGGGVGGGGVDGGGVGSDGASRLLSALREQVVTVTARAEVRNTLRRPLPALPRVVVELYPYSDEHPHSAGTDSNVPRPCST